MAGDTLSAPPPSGGPGARARRAGRAAPVILGATVVVVALNLRAGITAVGPLLGSIERTTGLPGALAGLLVALPLVAFGLCSPLAPTIARRAGIERTIFGALVLLVAGLLVRAVPGVGLLFVGTALLGTAVALANVLVPALIKREFPSRVGIATGLYAVSISAGGALGLGLAVPLVHLAGTGWRGGLALWAVPAAACGVVWLLQLRGTHRDISPVHISGRLWRDGLAWQVTSFMGLQALGFYATVAWVPSVLESHGMQAGTAGWLVSLAGFAALPAAFIAPLLGAAPRRRRVVVTVALVLDAAALVGLIVRPMSGSAVWMVVLGLAQGASVAVALNFIVVRAPDPARAAELSAMAQTVGYLLAAAGPLALGALHDVTGGWTVPLVVLVVALVPELLCGLGASRARVVGGSPVGPDPGDAGSRPAPPP